jgi:hypothetical protein
MAESHNPHGATRARRHAVQMPVLYRSTDSASWHTGQTVDLSASGVLFRGRQRLPRHAVLELSLEMPRALTGEGAVVLLCSARVVRHRASIFKPGSWTYGAAFQSCRVIHPAAPGASHSAGLRHRSNNLLSIIAGNADLILMREDVHEDVRDAAQGIRAACEELASLLRQSSAQG